ncbi:hypothetical protein [Desulfoluna butyratoxydans]|uniref:Uncharacterized protein n=1 Tax=Desulfoluna butyratoxydans TaxID=231438 RepID=A0A4U8YHR1_9BACT|nr:hypothetical protein [Desulfoluna butyratoxydans]VFQ42714.1 hypothetical protein MSL71_3350 [Desulfoluna butyratoxydans]
MMSPHGPSAIARCRAVFTAVEARGQRTLPPDILRHWQGPVGAPVLVMILPTRYDEKINSLVPRHAVSSNEIIESSTGRAG